MREDVDARVCVIYDSIGTSGARNAALFAVSMLANTRPELRAALAGSIPFGW